EISFWYVLYFFFFQAEDGIRDFHVTGVQTCALPISRVRRVRRGDHAAARPGRPLHRFEDAARDRGGDPRRNDRGAPRRERAELEIGRASCRERGEDAGVAGG